MANKYETEYIRDRFGNKVEFKDKKLREMVEKLDLASIDVKAAKDAAESASESAAAATQANIEIQEALDQVEGFSDFSGYIQQVQGKIDAQNEVIAEAISEQGKAIAEEISKQDKAIEEAISEQNASYAEYKQQVQGMIDELNKAIEDELSKLNQDAAGEVQNNFNALNTRVTELEGKLSKKISDYLETLTCDDKGMLLYDDGNGAKRISVETLKSDLRATEAAMNKTLTAISFPGAGAHNSIYRGKDLGTEVTAEQYAAIEDGSFDDLYIGDYWTIDDVNWRIAAFDYYLNTGDTICTTHHVVIVPDTCLGEGKQMNTTITTENGYTGSTAYKTGLDDAKTIINNAFGAGHILKHRQYLTTTVANGRPSAGSWFDSTVELMNEQNVYGGKVYVPTADGSTVPALYTIDKSHFPLFALEPSRITIRVTYWLRDVVSAANFADVNADGHASYHNASTTRGVRPAFSIKS